MKTPSYLLVAFCSAIALPAAAQNLSAQEQPRMQPQQWETRQSPPVVQRIYVSPGASGSVDSSSSWQRYDGYGGVPVPRGYGESRSSTVIIDQSGTGGLRQSIEYPDGTVYPYTHP